MNETFRASQKHTGYIRFDDIIRQSTLKALDIMQNVVWLFKDTQIALKTFNNIPEVLKTINTYNRFI